MSEMIEQAVSVRVHRMATTTREYDAITVCIAGMRLSCDVVSNRDIRLAHRLARSHGAHWMVAPELDERVQSALWEDQPGGGG